MLDLLENKWGKQSDTSILGIKSYFNTEIIELEITTLRWDIITLNRGLFKILTWTTEYRNASNDIPVEENQSHLQLQLVIKNRCSILALRYKNAQHFDNYWFDITDWHFDITDLNHTKTQLPARFLGTHSAKACSMKDCISFKQINKEWKVCTGVSILVLIPLLTSNLLKRIPAYHH